MYDDGVCLPKHLGVGPEGHRLAECRVRIEERFAEQPRTDRIGGGRFHVYSRSHQERVDDRGERGGRYTTCEPDGGDRGSPVERRDLAGAKGVEARPGPLAKPEVAPEVNDLG